MKEPQRSILEITKKAMKAFFGVIDLKTRTGRQYFALFTLLYNTATRIDELLSLKLDDLHIGETAQYISTARSRENNSTVCAYVSRRYT